MLFNFLEAQDMYKFKTALGFPKFFWNNQINRVIIFLNKIQNIGFVEHAF